MSYVLFQLVDIIDKLSNSRVLIDTISESIVAAVDVKDLLNVVQSRFQIINFLASDVARYVTGFVVNTSP